MNHRDQRGVSLGTIVMLAMTLIVLIGFGTILPKLMGPVNIIMEDRAMRSSVNLNDSLPELSVNDIPLVRASETPAVASTSAPTATPVQTTATLAEATVTPTPSAGGTVNLTFGGSLNADSYIVLSGYYQDSDKYDFTETFSLIADELDSDHTLVTLEAITDPSGNVKSAPNAPAEMLDMITSVNADMVSIGYSRAYERGIAGLQATISQARARDLETLGAYDSRADADRLRIVEVNNVRIAYLHYVNVLSSACRKKLNSEGNAWQLPVITSDNASTVVSADAAKAREAGADVIIVCINWSGSEAFNVTSAKMKSFMQQVADAGADVIIGSGTKAVKEVSWIMGKRADGSTRQTLCAWSLGSLLNGERNNGNVAGMILHLQLSYNGKNVSFERVTYTPTYIWRYKQDGEWRYRVVASDMPAPDGMDDSHAANAERAFENIRKVLADSPVTLRTP